MGQKEVIEDIWKQIKEKIKIEWIISFVACFVIGFLTYGYLMANHFLTYDSIWNLYSEQDMITSGRQFLTYVCKISSNYDLPWLNGILAIFYMSVTSIFLNDIFEIRNKISIVLVSGLFVTFPSVISTYAYIYTIDGYMLAMLIATIAVWVTKKNKLGFILGIFLLGFSLGIYQAYLSYVMVLCVLLLLISLLYDDEMKKIFIQAGKYILMGIGGYLFYIITLNVMLAYKGQTLSGYQGTDAVNRFSVSGIPEGMKSAFMNFINFARWENVLTTTETMKYATIGILAMGIIIYIYLFFRQSCIKSLLKSSLVVILTATLPFCATVVNILSPDTLHHLLMRGAWSLFFIFAVVLADKLIIDKNKIICSVQKLVVVLTILVSAILVFEFSKMANVVGYNMQERYEKSYALSLRIVEMLEDTPGYEHGMKVAILGGEPDETIFPSTQMTQKDLSGYFGVDGDYFLNSTEKYAVFMAHYMNVTLTTIAYEEEVELANTEEFAKMKKFPNKECIQKIGDVWVVKLNG